MKKLLRVAVLCFSLAAVNIIFPIEAGASLSSGLVIKPMYSNINSFSNSFGLSESGMASVYSSLSARDSDMQTVSIYLERFNNGTWSSVKSWYATSYNGFVFVGDDYYVAKGQYRMRSTGCVYKDGRLVEMEIHISSVKSYF